MGHRFLTSFLLILLALAAPVSAQDYEGWFEVFLHSRKVGHLQLTSSEGEAQLEGRTVRHRVEESLVTFRRGTEETKERLSREIYLDPESGTPLRRVVRRWRSDNEVLVVDQRFEGNTVHQTLQLEDAEGSPLGPSETRSFERDPQATLGSELALLELERRGYRVGDEEAYREFDDESGKLEEGLYRVKARRMLEHDEILVVEQQGEGQTVEMWLDTDGNPVRISLTDQGLRFEKSSREQALSGELEGDTVSLMAVSVPGGIPRVYELDELRLRVTSKGQLPALPEDSRQQVERRGDALEVVLRRTGVEALAELPVPARYPEELSDSLAASLLIQSDHPEIRAVAREVAGEEPRALARLRKLTRWVFENVAQKSYEVNYASAVDTLRSRTGDCTEHSILLAALARASGLPTRLCFGMAYDGAHSLAWHQWNEVYLGNQWIGVDPSSGSVGIHCGYVKLLAVADPAEAEDLPVQAGLVAEPVSARVGERELLSEQPSDPRVEEGLFLDPGRGLMARLPNADWAFQKGLSRGSQAVLFTMAKSEKFASAVLMVESLPEGMTMDAYLQASRAGLEQVMGGFQDLGTSRAELAGQEVPVLSFSGTMMEQALEGAVAMLPGEREMLVLLAMEADDGTPGTEFATLAACLTRFDERQLLEDLRSPDRARREAAAGALGLLGTTSAREPLRAALERELETGGEHALVFARALGRLGGAGVERLLLELSRSSRRAARVAAAAGLAPLEGNAAGARLAALVLDPSSLVADAALEVLPEARSAEVVPTLAAAGPREEVIGALAEVAGEASVEVLVRWLQHRDAGIRVMALEGLEAIDSPASTRALVKGLTHADPELRARAAAALAGREGLEDSELVEQALLDPHPETVEQAASLVEDPERLRPLADHPALTVRAAVLPRLLEDEPAVVRALRQDKPSVRAALLVALEETTPGEAVRDVLLEVMVEDPVDSLRVQAAELLGALDYPTAATAVLRALDDPARRARAVTAAGALGGPRLEARLVELVDDESAEVRRNLVYALPDVSKSTASRTAAQTLLADGDSRVREAAREVLPEDVPVEELPETALARLPGAKGIEAIVARAGPRRLGSLLRTHRALHKLPWSDYLTVLEPRLTDPALLLGLHFGFQVPAEELRPWFSHTSAQVRRAACLTVEIETPPDWLAERLATLSSDPDPAVAAAALWKLARVDPERADRMARPLLGHSDPVLSRVAWWVLDPSLEDAETIRNGPAPWASEAGERLLERHFPEVVRDYQETSPELALEAAKKGLELAPDARNLWALVGRLHLSAGRSDEAVEAFRRALGWELTEGWRWRAVEVETRRVDGEWVSELLPWPGGAAAALSEDRVWLADGSGWRRGRKLPTGGSQAELSGLRHGDQVWVWDELGERGLWRYDLTADAWHHLETLGENPPVLATEAFWALSQGDSVWVNARHGITRWRPAGAEPGPRLPSATPVVRQGAGWWLEEGQLVRLDLETGAVRKLGLPATLLPGTFSFLSAYGTELQLVSTSSFFFAAPVLSQRPDNQVWTFDPAAETWREMALPAALAQAPSLVAAGDWLLDYNTGVVVRSTPEGVEALLLKLPDHAWEVYSVALDGDGLALDFGDGLGRIPGGRLASQAAR